MHTPPSCKNRRIRRRRGGRYIPIFTFRMTTNRAIPGTFHKQNTNIGRKTHTPGGNAGYHETQFQKKYWVSVHIPYSFYRQVSRMSRENE